MTFDSLRAVFDAFAEQRLTDDELVDAVSWWKFAMPAILPEDAAAGVTSEASRYPADGAGEILRAYARGTISPELYRRLRAAVD